MSRLQNSLQFILLILLVFFSLYQLATAQEKLPKSFLHDSFSLQSQAVEDTVGCNTLFYYGPITYFFTIPSSSTSITTYAQRFSGYGRKKLSSINLLLYTGFNSFSDTSGQGIEMIVYEYANGYPGAEILRIQDSAINLSSPTATVSFDVSSYNLNFEDQDYFIGFTVVNQAVDTFAILSDDGINSSSNNSVSVGYGDEDGDGIFSWYYLVDVFGENFKFTIDAIYCFNPTTIRVPEDYSTIQEAVDSAYGYDTILVNDGGYAGAEVFQKQIIFKSVNGQEYTTIDGSLNTGMGLKFSAYYNNTSNWYNAEIDGFRFINCSGTTAGAISATYYHPLTIRNSVFYNNHATSGAGAINCGGLDLLIENCTFSHNSTTNIGAAINIRGGQPIIRNSIISNTINGTSISSTTAYSNYPVYTIECTNIYNNQLSNWAGQIVSQEHTNNNFSLDPLFCDTSIGDLHINDLSFCNANHPLNNCGVQIGALGVNCSGCVDSDSDGICDLNDNCPTTYNSVQTDSDLDGIGDSCDTCTDSDNDGYGNVGFPNNTCPDDNCPDIYNPDQSDSDLDGIGDSCDTCTDTDNDGYGNVGFPNNTCPDDNCPDIYNPDQSDSNNGGIGNACCCDGIRGNINGDPLDSIDISDLITMVELMFNNNFIDPIFCASENDVDGSGELDIADLVYMVAYMFQGGPPPVNCP